MVVLTFSINCNSDYCYVNELRYLCLTKIGNQCVKLKMNVNKKTHPILISIWMGSNYEKQTKQAS